MSAHKLLCTTQLGSISSLRCQKSRMPLRPEWSMRNSFSSRTMLSGYEVSSMALRSRRLAEPKLRRSKGWWSQTGSNRRPHACKARALPAELCPRSRDECSTLKTNVLQMMSTSSSSFKDQSAQIWWAWEDLNFRPHAYQARALTN